ncbi:MAG: PorT family protein [Paludibacter sp.]|nr:PorT family protein [Paludibacter sp.]
MKNNSLLMLIALFVFAGTGMAQTSDFSEKISIGVKAGANISNVYDTQGDEFDADAKLGFAAGAFVQIPLGRFLGFHPEILFSQKGYQGSGSILGSDYNYTRTTNFIDVPLLIALKASPFVTFLVGPQYSYLVSQKYYLHTALGDVTEEEHFENENLLKNTLSVTGGFDINLSSIVIGARAGWDITNNKGDGTSTTPRYKNMWYQATVGYRF